MYRNVHRYEYRLTCIVNTQSKVAPEKVDTNSTSDHYLLRHEEITVLMELKTIFSYKTGGHYLGLEIS